MTTFGRGLQRATIQHHRRGPRGTSVDQAQDGAEIVDHGFEAARGDPALGLLVDHRPGRQFLWQQPPEGSRSNDPAHGSEHFAAMHTVADQRLRAAAPDTAHKMPTPHPSHPSGTPSDCEPPCSTLPEPPNVSSSHALANSPPTRTSPARVGRGEQPSSRRIGYRAHRTGDGYAPGGTSAARWPRRRHPAIADPSTPSQAAEVADTPAGH
jgi:hypothetical protein